MFDNFAMTEIISSETQTAEYGMYFIQFQFQNAWKKSFKTDSNILSLINLYEKKLR